MNELSFNVANYVKLNWKCACIFGSLFITLNLTRFPYILCAIFSDIWNLYWKIFSIMDCETEKLIYEFKIRFLLARINVL